MQGPVTGERSKPRKVVTILGSARIASDSTKWSSIKTAEERLQNLRSGRILFRMAP